MGVIYVIIGNSHVRTAILSGQAFVPRPAIKTATIKKPSCFRIPKTTKKIVAVSVVPWATDILKKFASKNTIALDIFTNKNFPFANHTDQPNKVGTDRLLAVMGAYAMGIKPPLMIIDMGSAITINIVDDHYQFVGGMIAPNQFLMAQSLHHWTASLPMVAMGKGDNDKKIGTNTKDAIAHGTAQMTRAFVLSMAQMATGQGRDIVITGGTSAGIANLANAYPKTPNWRIEPELLFWGLVAWQKICDTKP